MKKVVGLFAILLMLLSLSVNAKRENNELDYASTKDIMDINPHLYLGEMAAQNMVFEPLVLNREDGGVSPFLAKRWEVSADGKSYRFYLRDDVYFNDGEKFNAQAVKLNIDAVLANKARHAWMGLINEINQVNVIDADTVELTLYHPYYPTLTELGVTRPFRFISPKSFIHGQTKDGVKDYAGTGPWMLAEHKKNQYARFVVNPHYWGKKPALNSVVWHVIPDRQTLLLALQKGDIQMIFGADGDMTDMEAYQAFSSKGQFATLMSAPIASRAIVLNSNRPITHDIFVRQALEYAVNKADIVTGVLNDSETLAGTLMSPSAPYSDVKVKTYHYNPDKARALLTQAGWLLPAGQTVRVKEDERLTLLLSYDTNNAAEKEIAELIQDNFKQIGVELSIIGEEKQAFLDRQKRGDFDLQYSLSWGKPYDPASFVSSFRVPAHADYQAQLGLASRAYIYKLIDDLLISTDEIARQADYRELFELLADEAIYIPLSYSRTKVIYDRQVTGVGFNVSQYEIPFEKMSFRP
ncbi:nickel ABC transporter substrate-binding protein [Utexia brackfieldae]|uniref:nickel ABC transporter substrate-binding protein n=1 Tax=Utexia brackfieldae TaxID=3074108 RepID=UPI00370D273D